MVPIVPYIINSNLYLKKINYNIFVVWQGQYLMRMEGFDYFPYILNNILYII